MKWRFVPAMLAVAVGVLLTLPIVAFALILAGMSSCTRVLAGLLGGRRVAAPWRDLVEYEPVVGWRPRANLDAYAQADDIFHLTTGSDGWRGHIPLEDADIVVFGDSFSFGHGANDDEMYTEFCGDLRVKSIGSDGYDMVHGLLWMQRLAPELAGKLVVWFVYYGNDLHENLLPNMGKYRMPYVRQRPEDRAWETVVEHVSPDPWPFKSPTSYHPIMANFSSSTPFSRRVFSACEYMISEAAQLCDAVGARLVVVGIPDRVQLTSRGQAKLERLAPPDGEFDVAKPDRELGRIAEGLGVRFVSLREHLTARDYLVHDIHWRRSGHRKVGQVLRELMIDAVPMPASQEPRSRADRVEVAS